MVRSGGPHMTVTKVAESAMTGEPTVWCTWFVGNKQHEGTFSPEALMLVPRRRAMTVRF